ncbi:HNH endonuclease [Serratia phage Moabite]|uniref:HNH endonuclease n=3 Tax=Moabitevirus TaxID=2843422 RepID=A0A4Y5TPF8_9CAUD|nr:HNH endonuclease [Serratia phage vB_SmaM_ 2050HW]YP_009849266.1 HNH endonuclease [Serratia phage Moabite]QPX76652.1 putative AP2 domain-containing protein [Serratia phage vB_SmaM_Yaphecito]UCR74701.1 hypothetical protein [Serratia phage BUCT660]UGO54057.1 putative AP2 domain containing protein [Serratia phage vB_SmaM_Haymo]UQT03566.1 hypothetical protein KODAMA_00990 [Serratia phage vB_SmaM-Kodama]URG14269.1 HNH endonuclease [Pectobacterium phage vB_ParM-25]
MKAFEDLTNKQYGRLTVVGLSGMSGHSRWKCICSCGVITYSCTGNLVSGRKQSCGCLKVEKARAQHKGTGKKKNGDYTWTAWYNLIYNRTFNAAEGNGIEQVDPRWLEYQNFKEDLGEKPGKGYYLHRIDANKPYNKDNCKWSKMPTGKRKVFYYNTKHKHPDTNETVAQLSRRLDISTGTIYGRLRRGLSILEAIEK